MQINSKVRLIFKSHTRGIFSRRSSGASSFRKGNVLIVTNIVSFCRLDFVYVAHKFVQLLFVVCPCVVCMI